MISPASFHDTYQAISAKAEEMSGAKEEEDLAPTTFPEIMAEREVSCVSVSTLVGFPKYMYLFFFYEHSVYELLLL
jgi:hypothetical protein